MVKIVVTSTSAKLMVALILSFSIMPVAVNADAMTEASTTIPFVYTSDAGNVVAEDVPQGTSLNVTTPENLTQTEPENPRLAESDGASVPSENLTQTEPKDPRLLETP